jgi:hypothetical protein
MVLALINQLDTANTIIESASTLAFQLQKKFCVMYLVHNEKFIEMTKKEIETQLSILNLATPATIDVQQSNLTQLLHCCEEKDASFLFLQLPLLTSKTIQTSLRACRELRIPYILFNDNYLTMNTNKVLVPVGFLEEEMEKAQFASALGRFCNSHIHLLLANDAGTKAKRNAEKMKRLFEKFNLSWTESKSISDSFKVDRESVQIAEKDSYGLLIISASREYGLDDIIFGSKEYHLLRKSKVPVLLVNPRGDLYALCD